ncbi:unnamed protein product [Fusarium graminearum]|nr:unnamed protein product [Fusarium graminearum]
MLVSFAAIYTTTAYRKRR